MVLILMHNIPTTQVNYTTHSKIVQHPWEIVQTVLTIHIPNKSRTLSTKGEIIQKDDRKAIFMTCFITQCHAAVLKFLCVHHYVHMHIVFK